MMTINKIKEAITPIAVAHGLKRVYLFGSYAKGTSDENSDVDLLIEKGEGLTLVGLSEIILDAREALHKKVDVLSVGGLSDDFRHEIAGSEILIYGQ